MGFLTIRMKEFPVLGSATPEAFEPMAPGWLERTHPEGGAKTSPVRLARLP